ncbi:hypothetical protein K503DRAFT_208833 [Rhizopogon vinicolor AM-OR11-026]|uniref:Uncharacterized protein n=1 Tax=Rhizopogon vinicolor AM-OR11-026 TaxID=1314800 RepID=A0A1B7MYW7_9AGAM|nr:hypothetical protein K503DRAFT_208833 [Rhizopogon vinicolor AM-OR11-026]
MSSSAISPLFLPFLLVFRYLHRLLLQMCFNIIRFPPLAGFLFLVTFPFPAIVISLPEMPVSLLLTAPSIILKQELKLPGFSTFASFSACFRTLSAEDLYRGLWRILLEQTPSWRRRRLLFSLSTDRKRPPRSDKPNPDDIKVSSKELNQDIRAGRSVDNDVPPPPPNPRWSRF